MLKPGHVYIAVSEQYRQLREMQTMLNRMVWSTELCYGYFENVFSNRTDLADVPIEQLFKDLPIQAWFKNKKGTGKYNLPLGEHLDVVRANQVHICKLAIILFNSYFDDYLEERLGASFPVFKKLTSPSLSASSVKVSAKAIFEADCCRSIRNLIVHEPEKALAIEAVREDIDKQLVTPYNEGKSFLSRHKVNKEQLGMAINKVVDSAIGEVKEAAKRGVTLPYEYFFMLYTFTNYDALAAEIEQVLYYDEFPKTFFNPVNKEYLDEDRYDMITGPAVTGCIYCDYCKKPVQAADVRVVGNPFRSSTDANGLYLLSPNLKDGVYTLQINAQGYETATIQVTTAIRKTCTLDIPLKRKKQAVTPTN